MEIITIDKKDMAEALSRAQEHYILTAPVKTGHGYTVMDLEKGQIPDLSYNSTALSFKASVFPQNQVMFQLSKGPEQSGACQISDIDLAAAPRAVVGIPPYDAKAIEMLELNFDTAEFKDPYFIRMKENLTLVGLAENHPDTANFSTGCGTGPFDDSCLDILLVDTGSAFCAEILTPKGEAFAKAAGFPKTSGTQKQINQLKKTAEDKINGALSFEHLKEIDTLLLYEAPVWKDLAFACINCSTCTFVCPTCWCFDIQDEAGKTGGTRLRVWDSCMSDLYSAHASGHNPRQEGWQRFRNRFMHKLKYFQDKYSQGPMCVGCGRCIRSCPAGIDIRTISDALCRFAENESGSQTAEVAS